MSTGTTLGSELTACPMSRLSTLLKLNQKSEITHAMNKAAHLIAISKLIPTRPRNSWTSLTNSLTSIAFIPLKEPTSCLFRQIRTSPELASLIRPFAYDGLLYGSKVAFTATWGNGWLVCVAVCPHDARVTELTKHQ